MSDVLVVAAHPDDETLGCGGALLRHVAEGDTIHWVIATAMTAATGHSAAQIEGRSKEIGAVSKAFNFASVTQFGFESAGLYTVPRTQIIGKLSELIAKIKPQTVYLPFPGDVHSDHRILFECALAATKKFRAPFISKILTCEILSETEFGLDPSRTPFRPNLFINISDYLDEKIRIMNLYQGETGEFPFPRSETAIRALATLRGAQSATTCAEAFMILAEYQ
jgi:N-acetylglucosamine malate deacetylase 1